VLGRTGLSAPFGWAGGASFGHPDPKFS
jgi:hypothetical protein